VVCSTLFFGHFDVLVFGNINRVLIRQGAGYSISSSRYRHAHHLCERLWNGQTVLAHSFDVEFNSLSNTAACSFMSNPYFRSFGLRVQLLYHLL
jgi:hypothetical protein